MWKCPVCDQENAATVCPNCGYDRTCDYERYPTAFAVTAAKPTHTLRRQWQAKQGSAVNGGDRQAAQGCQGYVDSRWLEKKATGQVTLSPKEAARGCTKSASLKCGDKYVHLTLSIPAGVVYGEKLRYPQVSADDGTAYDATAEVKIEESSWYVYLSYISFIITALPALIALIVCLFKGFSFSSGLAWIIVFAATFIASIVTSIISITRDSLCEKKYGPKTPEEKQRCEASRQTDVPQQLFELYQHESDQAKRIEYLKKAAEMGFTPAQAELGDCYAQGRGVERDYAKASEWYRRAAEPPEPPKQTETPQQLFELYQQESDRTKWIEYLKMSAQQGHVWAQCELGGCYASGRGVEQDEAQAVQWYRKAAEQGYAEALASMAYCYSEGHGVKKNTAEAARWFQKLAQQDAPEAQHWMGHCYSLHVGDDGLHHLPEVWYWMGHCCSGGWGIEKDMDQAAQLYRKAVQWYHRAAEQGSAGAQYSLGRCYANGTGVKKNLDLAVQWYKKAAQQGNRNAQLSLALCYENGWGVQKIPSLAREWRKKALNNN